MTKRRTTVPAHVDVEIPAVPTTTQIPPYLGKTLIWVGGMVVLGLGGLVSWNSFQDHRKAEQLEHDAQFQKVEQAKTEKAAIEQKMKDHERDDITAVKELSGSIKDLTNSISQALGSAEVGRNYTQASNLEIKASLADLIAQQCRKDNLKDFAVACHLQEQNATQARQEATTKRAEANQGAAALQRPLPSPAVSK